MEDSKAIVDVLQSVGMLFIAIATVINALSIKRCRRHVNIRLNALELKKITSKYHYVGEAVERQEEQHGSDEGSLWVDGR